VLLTETPDGIAARAAIRSVPLMVNSAIEVPN